MQRIDELTEELKDGQITLANGTSGSGQNLYQGRVLEVYPSAGEVFTIKYTVERFGFGSLDDLDKVAWQESNGVATWSLLRVQCERDANGIVSFSEPTLRGSTALIIPLAEEARIAA